MVTDMKFQTIKKRAMDFSDLTAYVIKILDMYDRDTDHGELTVLDYYGVLVANKVLEEADFEEYEPELNRMRATVGSIATILKNSEVKPYPDDSLYNIFARLNIILDWRLNKKELKQEIEKFDYLHVGVHDYNARHTVRVFIGDAFGITTCKYLGFIDRVYFGSDIDNLIIDTLYKNIGNPASERIPIGDNRVIRSEKRTIENWIWTDSLGDEEGDEEDLANYGMHLV